MYTKWYVNRKPKPVVHHAQRMPQQQNPQLPVPQSMSGAWERAKKLGITVMEYNKRCGIIDRELQHLQANIGDTVYPKNFNDYKEHGKLIIRAVCRHYDNYGDLVWNEATPFVLQVSPLDCPNQTINCTVAWVSKHMPIEDTMHQDC